MLVLENMKLRKKCIIFVIKSKNRSWKLGKQFLKPNMVLVSKIYINFVDSS